jgi:OOP family OmpA-OmpF porin
VKGFKFIFLIFLIYSSFDIVKCQNNSFSELSAKQLKHYAKNAKNSGDLYTAIFLLERYYNINKKSSNINYELAELQRKTRNYSKARDIYKQLTEEAPNKYPLARFYYAQMLKATGEYDKAIEQFNKFKKDYKGEQDAQELNKILKIEINGCDSAKLSVQNPLNITINSLNSSINGPHIELSPIPLDDNNFIYASLKIDSLIYFNSHNFDTAMPVRQLYQAKKEGMDWIGGKLLKGNFNIPGVETGNGVFSRDGNRFYFTRCEKDWHGKAICAIYISKKIDGIWSEPKKLPPVINNPDYTSTQPAIGRTAKSDREIIYFVSDRPEGKGGLDIWYSVWNDQKDIYSKPRNLGSKVNTVGDEMTPFYYYPGRTLYYSSTGIAGLGGLDAFKAFGERNKWFGIKNVGYPINSSYDDLYFTVSNKGEDGFFVSNRPDSINKSTCCDDIFYYRWNDFIRITVTGTIYPFEKDRYGRKKDLSNFDFMNPDENIKPLSGAKVALFIQDKDSKEYVFVDRYTTMEDGRFYFTLLPDEDYEFKMEGFQYFDSKNYLSTQYFDFSDTIAMPPTWVNVLSDKPIVLENIYYDFNSSELSQKTKKALDSTLLVMLKEAPEFIIEIGSHTDSIGEVQYNLELSQARADNVVKYLISKGIANDRLISKGYGAMNPLAPNYNPDGSDNVSGREKNRRTEFRIVGTVDDTKDVEDEEYISN